MSRYRHRGLGSSLIDIIIVRRRHTSSLTGIIVVCHHCSSTLSVIALADWRHRRPLPWRSFDIADVIRQASGWSSCLSSSIMADLSLGDKYITLHTNPTVATSGFALTPGPANNFTSWTDASAMAHFSMELRELEAVSTPSTLSQVSENHLHTQAIMHELSADSEVTFRKVLGSAEILPTGLRIPSPWIHRRTGVVCSLRQ